MSALFCLLWLLLNISLSVVAAATEYDHYCKNDNPGTVVVEDVA